MLDVVVLTLGKILFEGKAKSVILPGEKGTFEVLPYHKPLLSRLITGPLIIDGQHIFIKRGIVKVALNKVMAVVEEK
jgi:F0F1-type ATP synthase epsilon subunit